jgi:hypothetical protein
VKPLQWPSRKRMVVLAGLDSESAYEGPSMTIDESDGLNNLIGHINWYEPHGGSHPMLHISLERYLAALPDPGFLKDYNAAREARFTDDGKLRPTTPTPGRNCAGCMERLSEELRAVHGRVRSVIVCSACDAREAAEEEVKTDRYVRSLRAAKRAHEAAVWQLRERPTDTQEALAQVELTHCVLVRLVRQMAAELGVESRFTDRESADVQFTDGALDDLQDDVITGVYELVMDLLASKGHNVRNSELQQHAEELGDWVWEWAQLGRVRFPRSA